MEVIQDELQKNGIRVDITTVSIHINEILGRYKDVYNDVANRLNPKQLTDVFHETSVNTRWSCHGLLNARLQYEYGSEKRMCVKPSD